MSGTTNVQGGAFDPSANYHVTGTWVFDNNPSFTGATFVNPAISGTVTGSPTITTPTLTTPTINAPIYSDYKVLASSLTYDANVVPAVITGFSWTVVPGVYIFEVNLPATMTTNGGLTVSFVLTTAALTSIQYQSYAATAVDNTTAVSTSGTTTTSATKVFDSRTAAYTGVSIRGSMVVATGGTFQWNGCQNTSAASGDASLILLGAYAKLQRVS